jgi:hypothetical protein
MYQTRLFNDKARNKAQKVNRQLSETANSINTAICRTPY